MRAASLDHPVQWANIAVVSSPGEGYMAVRWHKIIRRIHIDPANPRTIRRQPCMRSIRAHQPRLPGRRIRSQVSTHVASRQIERTQAGDLKLRKILAHAPLLPENLFGRGADGGHLRVESKILVNPRCQIKQRLAERPSRDKRRRSVRGKLRARPDARRFKSKLVRFESRRTWFFGDQSHHFFPWNRILRGRRVALHLHFTARLDNQLLVRLLNGKKVVQISEVINPLCQRRRDGINTQLATRHLLVGQHSRL